MKIRDARVRTVSIIAVMPLLYALMGMQLGCFFPEPEHQPRSGHQDRRDEHRDEYREGDRDHRENHEGREQQRGRPEDSNHR